MKRYFLLLAAVILTTLSYAQTTTSFGLRAGVSSSGMRGDAVNSLNGLIDFANGSIKTTDRTGFFAGPYASIPVTDMVTLEPALYYSEKGYVMQGDFNMKGAAFLGANAKAQLISQYIDIPLLLKVNLDGLQIFAGPQVSYLAKANFKTTAGVLGFNLLNKTMDATSQFNRWDGAITAGVGYKFSKNLNIMASYDYGLSKVDANQNLNAYNRSIKLGVGFNF